MTYSIGDRTISVQDGELSAEDAKLFKAHPQVFKKCLNAATHNYLLCTKKVVHLYVDIAIIYTTLLSKVHHYDDIRAMATKAQVSLLRLEQELNTVFGIDLDLPTEGWEAQNYESAVKPMAVLIVQSCIDTFDLMYKTVCCIEVFFNSFDNLKKLLVPCLPAQTQMVQKSLAGASNFLRLSTAADQVAHWLEFTPLAIKQLAKIDIITCGLQRESRLLEVVFNAADPSVQQYTLVLLGRAILKQDVSNAECRIIHRRNVCYKAAEHVVCIPLSGKPAPASFISKVSRHVVYLCSALLLVALAVAYRVFRVVFG